MKIQPTPPKTARDLARENPFNLLEGLLPPSISPSTPSKPPKSTKSPRRKAAPLWNPAALIVIHKTHLCRCGRTHHEANPLILLRETSPTGAIHETAQPKTPLHHLAVNSLPIEIRELPSTPTPFCLECLKEGGVPIHTLFMRQQTINPNKKEA